MNILAKHIHSPTNYYGALSNTGEKTLTHYLDFLNQLERIGSLW